MCKVCDRKDCHSLQVVVHSKIFVLNAFPCAVLKMTTGWQDLSLERQNRTPVCGLKC